MSTILSFLPDVLHYCIFGYLQKSENILIFIFDKTPIKVQRKMGIHRKDDIYHIACLDKNLFVISEYRRYLKLQNFYGDVGPKLQERISILAAEAGDLKMLKSIEKPSHSIRNICGSLETTLYIQNKLKWKIIDMNEYLNSIIKKNDIGLLKNIINLMKDSKNIAYSQKLTSEAICRSCIESDNLQILKWFVKTGFLEFGILDINWVLRFTISRNRLNIFKWLVTVFRNFTIEEKSLVIAANTGNMEFFLLVIKYAKGKPHVFTDTVFSNAIKGGNIEMLEYLENKRSEQSKDLEILREESIDLKLNPIHYALRNFDSKTCIETINWLMKRGFQLTGDCYELVIDNKRIDILDFLLKQGVKIPKEVIKEYHLLNSVITKWFITNSIVLSEDLNFECLNNTNDLDSEADLEATKWLLDSGYITDKEFDEYFY